MTDKARVIGASTKEGDDRRLELLPDGLHNEMSEILEADNVAIGKGSIRFYGYSDRAKKNLYIITRDKYFKAPIGCKVVHDYMELVKRFKDSDDGLTVIGGLTILKLFAPYASELDIAETDVLVPGDLVFNDWDTDDFELVRTKEWSGGKTSHYIRKKKLRGGARLTALT